MGTETELKLQLDPEILARLRRHPLIRQATEGRPVRRNLVSIYYDTPEGDLWHHGIALRLRREGGRWIQTLKTQGKVALGLHQREEWETPRPKPTLDLQAIPEAKLRKWLSKRDLRPVFRTRFQRTLRVLNVEGTRIEMALDRGVIEADGKTLPLCEVELELRSGLPARLFDVALKLLERIPFRIENASKAERGYFLLDPKPPAPCKASPVGLQSGMGVEEAYTLILQGGLAQLQCNEQAVLAGDGEGVHQMRVAIRRLRAVLNLFRPLIPKPAELEKELKWLNGFLGPARDRQVFLSETLEPLIGMTRDEVLEAFRPQAEASIEGHLSEIKKALLSTRYTRLLLLWGLWLADGPWRGSLPSQPIEAFAAHILERRYRKVIKQGERLDTLDDKGRHRLRIQVKKLRYGAEYLGEVYKPKRVRPFIKALIRLQDLLGKLNDGAVARHILEGAPVEVIYAVEGWHACHRQRILKRLPKAWKAFAGERPFWS